MGAWSLGAVYALRRVHYLVQLSQLFCRHLGDNPVSIEERDSEITRLLKHCRVQLLPREPLSVRTRWQLIQVHLPLGQEANDVHFVRYIFVAAKFCVMQGQDLSGTSTHAPLPALT